MLQRATSCLPTTHKRSRHSDNVQNVDPSAGYTVNNTKITSCTTQFMHRWQCPVLAVLLGTYNVDSFSTCIREPPADNIVAAGSSSVRPLPPPAGAPPGFTVAHLPTAATAPSMAMQLGPPATSPPGYLVFMPTPQGASTSAMAITTVVRYGCSA